MPRAEKQEFAGNHKKNNRQSHSPYNQSGRKAKMTSTRSWSPSIWNVLTFWKSSNTSHEEYDDEEEYDRDVSMDHDETSTSLNPDNAIPTAGGDDDHDTSPLNISNLSEEQVIASLTQSSRHVHFQLPNSDHERLNNRNTNSDSDTSVRRGPRRTYVAPLPPSSPLHQSGSSQDPLTKVSEYIDNVLRPRGGECTDVEALGLSMLIQSSVNQSGTQHGTPPKLNPFLPLKTNSGSSLVSSSPSSIRPMFTSRSTDINAVLASSSGASGSPSITSISNASSPSTSSPSRTLTQNPNGSLYYQGGGSARSRYRSPAFGSPARKKVSFSRHFGEGQGDTLKVNGSVAETPSPSDGKRRRVGEARDSSVAQASGSHPTAPNGTSTPPRTTTTSASAIRFDTFTPASRILASTPARPSPLRQSIRADSSSPVSSSPSSANGGSPRSRASNSDGEGRSRASEKAGEKASEIMAGIIKDATPKKDSVPDVRNPYQPSSRSPTKRSRKTPARAPRPPPRPTRQSTGSPSTPQPKKLSALETIQRTAPQAPTGSKRSHTGMPTPASSSEPVNGVVNRAAASQTGSSASKPVVIELDEDEEEEPQGPPVKKQKSDTSQSSKEGINTDEDPKAQTCVDIEDVDMDVTTPDKVVRPTEVIDLDKRTEPQQSHTQQQQQQETKRPIFAGPLMKGIATSRFQSAPKEPSPLRQSFQPDMPPSPPENPATVGKVSSTSSAFVSTSAPSPFGSISTSSPFAQTSSLSSFAHVSASSAFMPVKAPSPFESISTSPFSPKSAPSPFSISPVSAKDAASPPADDAAPAPAIPVPTPPDTPSASTDTLTDWVALAKKEVLEVPVSSLPNFAFAFTTSTFLSEYADQRDAALAVPTTELPKFDFVAQAPGPKVQIKAFNWAAVGMKPPARTGWTCGMCACQNVEDLTKCGVCGEDKP